MVILLLMLLAQTNVNTHFQITWSQIGQVDGWHIAVMDVGTTNIRTLKRVTTNALPLTKDMFPKNGIWDLRANSFTSSQTSIWNNPLTINWQYIGPPKNLRIHASSP